MDNITSVEYDLYQSHVQKLKDYCKSAELLFTLECGRYPITLTIRPDEYYHQMSLLESAEQRRTDGAMTFTLEEGEIRITALPQSAALLSATPRSAKSRACSRRFPPTGHSLFSAGRRVGRARAYSTCGTT